jgi:hypothetical protein
MTADRRMTIASDTAVTHHTSRRIAPFDVLKSLILSPNLCISFAGSDPERATERVLMTRSEVPSLDPDSIAEFLVRDRARDYIVASLQAGPTIISVKDGTIARGIPAAWIGDWAAFAEYQARLDIAKIDPAKQDLGQLQQLTDVIGDSHIKGVDGAVVRVVVAEDGFRYAGDGTIYFDFETHGTVTPEKMQITTSPPNYSLIQCVPHDTGVAAIGLYFPQGHFGYLLAPAIGGRRTLQGLADVADFVAEVGLRYGIDLVCPGYPF